MSTEAGISESPPVALEFLGKIFPNFTLCSHLVYRQHGGRSVMLY